MAQVLAFVEGWDFIQTLGEGAYGEVKLAINTESGEMVAVKIIDIKKAEDASAIDLVRNCILLYGISKISPMASTDIAPLLQDNFTILSTQSQS